MPPAPAHAHARPIRHRRFRFALTDPGGTVVWSSGGEPASGETVPDGDIRLPVVDGRYRVHLGEPDFGMASIPPDTLQRPAS